MTNRLIEITPKGGTGLLATILRRGGLDPLLQINEFGELISGEIFYLIKRGSMTVVYADGGITLNLSDQISTFQIQFDGDKNNNTDVMFQSAPCKLAKQATKFIEPAVPNEIVRKAVVPNEFINRGAGRVFSGDTKLSIFLKNQPIEAFNQQKTQLLIDFYQAIVDTNPMNMASKITDEEITMMNERLKTIDIRNLFFRGDPNQVAKNKAYLELLTKAKTAIDDCAKKAANKVDGKADSYDKATQVGAFGLDLNFALDDFYKELSSPANRKKLEDQRKVGKTKDKTTADAPVVSVNPSISELEATQARAQADNQIIFVSGSSGVNLFTNPAGDPTNVYTILDIMRDEQSAFIFESSAVIITDQPNITAIGDSQCEKVLGKLTPKQLFALIKTTKDQIDYNNRLLERLQLLTNKLKNSGSFKLSSLWSSFPDVKFSFGKSPGGRGPILDAIEKAAKTAYTNAKKSGEDAGKQLLDSAVTMANQASEDVQGVAKFVTNTLTEDTATLMQNVKDNAAALKNALDSLTDEDKALCSSLNEVAKVANAPQLVQSSIDKTKERAKRDAQKIVKYTQEAKTITENQNKLSNLAQNFTKALAAKK